METNPSAAGLDESRLSRIHDHLEQQYIQAGRLAGAQVAIARNGHIGYYTEVGFADRERNRPVAKDTIWRIYSMTKPIIGTALMSLYEKGLFQLTDPVSRFIPSFANQKVREPQPDGSMRYVEPRRPMNMSDAMMHMSGFGITLMGLPEMPGGEDPKYLDRKITLEEYCDRLGGRHLDYHPGEHWVYGISTDICGRLIEVLSGQRLDHYLQETIFDPLGMVDTGFMVSDDKIDRFSATYRRNRNKELVLMEDPQTSSYRKEPLFLSGGGGLVSTMGDYLTFTRMLVNGGELNGVRILGRKTVDLMTMNHLPDGADMTKFAIPGSYGEVGFEGMGFGFTMAVSNGPVETAQIGNKGDFMWGGYASTTFWCDPTEDLTVVFMTQFIPSGTFNFRGQLKSLVYPTLL
ncbi:MAG: serine hydrolase domain-containing protein [Acidimicrobiia bacterium]